MGFHVGRRVDSGCRSGDLAPAEPIGRPGITGDVALKEVLVTHNLVRDSLFDIHLSNGEKIEATPNHPFFVHGTWFHVKDLVAGDTLKRYAEDGELIIIDSLIARTGQFKVYNFTVADYHTYYVGQGEVLVHMCGG